MSVLNFIITQWDSILLIVAFAILVFILAKRGETAILNQIVFSLVTQAEKQFGEGMGGMKFSTVAEVIHGHIPSILRVLFTSKDIEKIIENGLAAAKIKWDSNNALKTYINESKVNTVETTDSK